MKNVTLIFTLICFAPALVASNWDNDVKSIQEALEDEFNIVIKSEYTSPHESLNNNKMYLKSIRPIPKNNYLTYPFNFNGVQNPRDWHWKLTYYNSHNATCDTAFLYSNGTLAGNPDSAKPDEPISYRKQPTR